MLRFIVIHVALLLALAVPANAITLEQTGKLADFINSTGSELAQTKTNLLQMAQGMESPEREQVIMIYDSVTNVECYFDKLSMVATMHSLMVNIRDQETLKKYIGLLAKHTVKATDVTINTTNRELAKIRSTAAIAEAQKIRDLVQKIRNQIQKTIPGS